MGTYKVFNGTDWVNICDCQVHIRNASNNWQLLDPANCVTKYWTGTEWCEVTCGPCECLPNYVLDPVTQLCERQTSLPATPSGGVFYPIIEGDHFGSYGDLGGSLYPNITNAVFPLNGFGFPTYVVKDNAGLGTTFTRTVSNPTNPVFNSQGIAGLGRLNDSSIWGQGYNTNTWFTVRFCVTIPETKTYIFGLAGDNQVRASITSTTFQGGVTSLNIVNLWGSNDPSGLPINSNNGRTFNYWHMFPIDLPAGDHVFELAGYNFDSERSFGAEVYDISVAELSAMMAQASGSLPPIGPGTIYPYIVNSTKYLIQDPPLLLPGPGQTGITYTCPDGYTFTDCNGAPQCVADPIIYPCGGTPPACECLGGDIIIGTQTWTCENLDVTTYRDNTPIPQVTDPTAWANLTTGAWCYYVNSTVNGITYGKLYNWYAVNDSRGLAPAGYHIPSYNEWTTLFAYLGGGGVAGGKMKQVGTSLWNAPNTDATNESCFTALPGGLRASDGTFDNYKAYGFFWSSSDNPGSVAPTAYAVQLSNTSAVSNLAAAFQTRGYSVRLIKD
jgi:uncharacterized protein (TIGR02145 family)